MLRPGIDDHDHFPRFMAAKTMFTDEGGPWDNVGWLFSGDRLSTDPGLTAAGEALRFLSPCSVTRTETRRWLDELGDLLSRDSRWLNLCVGLRDHASLGHAARQTLEYADPAVTGSALDAAAAAKAAQAAQARPGIPRLAPGSLVERYQRGDHRGVWRELGAVDPLEDAWRAEAGQVAVLTMQRVLRNAERLVAALIAGGWPVTADKALPGPAPDIEERLQQLEQLAGTAVPPALAAFWRVVGQINIVPRELWEAPFPDGVPESLAVADPLEIIDPSGAWSVTEEWKRKAARLHPGLAGPLKVIIAADYLHKANISGGGPYCVWLPCTGADPLIRDEEHELSFTDYLRLAFESKGFLRAGWEEAQQDGLARDQASDASRWLANVEYEHLDLGPVVPEATRRRRPHVHHRAWARRVGGTSGKRRPRDPQLADRSRRRRQADRLVIVRTGARVDHRDGNRRHVSRPGLGVDLAVADVPGTRSSVALERAAEKQGRVRTFASSRSWRPPLRGRWSGASALVSAPDNGDRRPPVPPQSRLSPRKI